MGKRIYRIGLTLVFCLCCTIIFSQSRVPKQPVVDRWLQVTGNAGAGAKDRVNITFFEVDSSVTGTIFFAINNASTSEIRTPVDEEIDPAGTTNFSLVGGTGCLSHSDSRKLEYTDGAGSEIYTDVHKTGTIIQSIDALSEVVYDDWFFFNGVVKEQGEKIGNKYYFKVVVTAEEAVQYKNAYQLDAAYNTSTPPSGINQIRAFSYAWCIALDDDSQIFDIFPFVPENDTGYLVFTNFDCDYNFGTAPPPLPTGAAYKKSEAETPGTPEAQPILMSGNNVIRNTSYPLSAGETNGTWLARYNEGPNNTSVINTSETWFWNSAAEQLNTTVLPGSNDLLYRAYSEFYIPPAPYRIFAAYADGTADQYVGPAPPDPAELEYITLQVVGDDDTPLPYIRNLHVSLSGNALIWQTNNTAAGTPNTADTLVTTGRDGIGWIAIYDGTAESVVVTIETDGNGAGTYNDDDSLPGNNYSVQVLFETSGGAPPGLSSASDSGFAEGLPWVLPVITLTENAAVTHFTAANDIHLRIPSGLDAYFNTGITPGFGGTAAGRVNGVTPVDYLNGARILRINLDSGFTTSQTLTITNHALTAINSASIGCLELSYSGIDGPYNVVDDKKITITGNTLYVWNGSTNSNWSEPANWSPNAPAGGPDGVAVNAVIQDVGANPAPVLDAGVASPVELFNLTIAANASLNTGTETLHINGTFSNSGTLYIGGTGGSVTMDNGMDSDSGSVIYQGAGGAIPFTGFRNLDLDGSGTWTLPAGTVNIYYDFLLEAGNTLDLDANGTDLYVYGNATVNGTLNVGSGSVFFSGQTTLNGNQITAGTDITFLNDVVITTDVTISTGAGVGGNITINQNITGQAGTENLILESGTGDITITGTLFNLAGVQLLGSSVTANQLTTGGDLTVRTAVTNFNNTVSIGGDLNFYTRDGSDNMGFGGAVAAYRVSDATLANISSVAGVIRFGEDTVQTGAIEIATVSFPGLVPDRPLIISTSGTILLNEDDGVNPAATALDNGAGALTIIAGGSLQAAVAYNAGGYQAELATTGQILIISQGGIIGTAANRIQFAAAQAEVTITSTGGEIYLDGVNGLTLDQVITGGANLTISTSAGSLLLNNSVATPLNAGTGNITLVSAGAINGSNDDLVADIMGGIISLTAAVGGIGTTTVLDLAAATAINATTADNSNILLDSIGTAPIGLLDAGGGDISLSLNTTGSVTDANGGAVNIIADELTVNSLSGIALDTDIRLLVNAVNSAAGDINIHELDTSTLDGLTVTSFSATSGLGGNVTLLADTGDLVINGWNLDPADDKNLSLQAAAGNLTYPDTAVNIGVNGPFPGTNLRLSAAGDVIRFGGANHDFTADNLFFYSNNSETAATAVATLNAAISGAGNSLTVNEADDVELVSISTLNGDVTLSTAGNGNITVGSISAGTGTVALNADGSIIDTAGNIAEDINASVINLIANTGIGAGADAQLELGFAPDISLVTDSGDIIVTHTGAATLVSTLAVTTGAGDISLLQTGGFALRLTTVTTFDGNITLSVASADLDLSAGIVTAGNGGNVTLSATNTAGSDVILGQVTGNLVTINAVSTIYDGIDDNAAPVANIIAPTVDLNAGSAIGYNGSVGFLPVIELSQTTVIAADTTDAGNGRINLANTSAAPVVISSLTAAGAGYLNYSQSGNQPVTVTTASINNGNITLANSGGANAGFIIGQITADTIDDVITITASGDLRDNADDALTDIRAFTISLRADSGGIGQVNGNLDLNATNLFSADTAAGNGSMALQDTTGDFPLGVINAGTGDVTLATVAGSILGSGTVMITATNLALTANGGTIGAAGTPVLTSVAAFEATAAGDIYITETDAVAVNTSLQTTAGNGSINLVSPGIITFNCDVSANGNGAITIDGPVELGADVSFAANAGNGDINFNNTLDSAAATNRNLTINAGTGNVLITNAGYTALIGGNDDLGDVTITGAAVTLNGFGTAGATGAAAVNVNATDIAAGTIILDGRFYNTSGNQVYSSAINDTRVLLRGAAGARQFRSDTLSMVFGDVFFDFDSANTLTIYPAPLPRTVIKTRHFVFYSGTLNLNSNSIQTTNDGLSGGDFVVLGSGAILDDADFAGANGYHDYPDRTLLAYDPGPGNYDAIFTGLSGVDILVGAGGTGSFFVNGTDLPATGNWALTLQPNEDANPRANANYRWGVPYAVALNTRVEYCSPVAGGNISAAEPAGGFLHNRVTHDANNQEYTPGVQVGWDFYAPTIDISSTKTVSDNTIEITFSEPMENAGNTLSLGTILVGVNNNGNSFNNCLTDLGDDPDSINTDLTVFRIVSPDTWNTDADGMSSGDAASTDFSGVHQNIIPNLTFEKGTFYDGGKNMIGRYSGATMFEDVADGCPPVLVGVYSGRSAHNNPVTTDWDAHNYFRLVYSEPVDIGDLDLTTGFGNVRADETFAAASEHGGYIEQKDMDTDTLDDDVLVTGFFHYLNRDLSLGTTDAVAWVNALRSDAANGHELYIDVAGYRNPAAPNNWPGYIIRADDPAGAALIIETNTNIRDKAALPNEFDAGSCPALTVTADSPWDVDPPQIARYTPTTDSFEIVTKDVAGSPYLDRLEFHVVDNPAAGWTSNPGIPDTTGGVRDSSFTDLNAFLLSRTSGLPIPMASPSFLTSVDNSLFDINGAINTANDPYFAISFDESIGYGELDEMHVAYDEDIGRVTDLAGNLLQDVVTYYICLERSPPEILYSLAAVGGHRVYVRFSEPVSGSGTGGALRPVDFLVDGRNPAGIITDLPDNTAPNKIKEAYLITATAYPVTANSSLEGTIRVSADDVIHDAVDNSMPAAYTHPLTDIGLNVVLPVWAADGLHQTDSYGPGFTALTEFDGTGRLTDNDITLQFSIQADNYTNAPLILHYDVDPPTDTLINGFWLPEKLLEFNNAANKETRILAPSSIQAALRNFIIPASDPEITAGKELQFLVKLGNRYCATVTDAEEPTSLSLWKIRIEDITSQAGGMTILNNVINPQQNQQTVVLYDLKRSGMVNVTVFSLDGAIIDVLHRGRQGKGSYRYTWDGRNRAGNMVARGLYFIRVTGPDIDEIRKVLIVKDRL